jgi:hypothetical protein
LFSRFTAKFPYPSIYWQQFLTQILTQPELGGFVSELELDWFDIEANPELGPLVTSTAEKLGLSSMMAMCNVDHTATDVQLVLLLHYTQNLQYMYLQQFISGRPRDKFLDEYLQARTIPLPPPDIKLVPPILGSLRSLVFGDKFSSPENPAPYLFLPSIESIAVSIHQDPQIPPEYYGRSPVKSLRLFDSQLSETGFENLMLTLRTLRELAYLQDMYLSPRQGPDFGKSLARFKDSLEKFEVDAWQFDCYISKCGSMKDFKKLKFLSCPIYLLMEGLDSEGWEDDLEGAQGPRLMDLLPESLEVLELSALSHPALEMIAEVVDRKDEVTPRLSNLALCGYRPCLCEMPIKLVTLLASLEAACKEAGVEFCVNFEEGRGCTHEV